MKLPAPSRPVHPLNSATLPQGTVLHRFFDASRAPNEFNPCRGQPTRFAPLHDDAGHCVPTLYAADSKECAAFETIFHSVCIPTEGMGKVRLARIAGLAHAEITLQRDLKQARLFAPDLRALKLKRVQLIDTPASAYRTTVKWAAAIHDDWPDIEGLVWTSNQCDPQRAYLFFGSRLKPADLVSGPVNRVGASAALLAELRTFGQRARIAITR